jgi:hypothetical protein
MAPLLAALMMFSVRSFRAARPIEEEFERFQDALQQMGAQGMGGKPDEGAAKAQTALQVAQLKEQGSQARQQAELAHKAQESAADRALELQKAQFEARKAEIELQIKQTELAIKQAELDLKRQTAALDVQDRQLDQNLRVNDQQHRQEMERQGAAQDAYQFEADGQRQDRQIEASQENPQESSPGA